MVFVVKSSEGNNIKIEVKFRKNLGEIEEKFKKNWFPQPLGDNPPPIGDNPLFPLQIPPWKK